jgi:hypothetical protein
MAGTLKVHVQLGDSATATNNFMVTAEAADGTMKIARGNKGATTQDILTVDASGKVAMPQGMAGGSLTLGTAIATTSGLNADFTGIPSWAKRITVMLRGVSLSGVSDYFLRVGNSGAFVTTGYASSWSYATTGVATGTSTAGFGMTGNSAAGAMSTQFVLTLQDAATNSWVCTQAGADTAGSSTRMGGGSITLSSALDRIRLTSQNGTDTFDAGSMNIMYEG